MALSHVVSRIFNVEKCQGHQTSHHSIEHYGFLLVFFSNFVPKMHRFFRYLTCKHTVTLKPGLGITQGHRKLYHSIRHPWLPINVP